MTTQNTDQANSRESNASSYTGAAGSTPSSAGDLNWGSARSDYGKNAYGGSLNKKGMGGKSIDDFKRKCCKDYFETRNFVKCISLCGDLEKAQDKLCLPTSIASA